MADNKKVSPAPTDRQVERALGDVSGAAAAAAGAPTGSPEQPKPVKASAEVSAAEPGL